ncbi:S8 family peptidase [Actinoplanes sp. NPDC049118]|uniref:S8 family peptidase n=1 Tax=Actinoplanes sp. NPDC049118 TaxID=3155769 RepID=UPI0033E3430F
MGKVERRRATIAGIAAALLVATMTGAAPPPADKATPERYIVTLRPAERPATLAAGSLATEYGGAVLHTYRRALNGFVLRATEAEARRLAADPRVAAVEPDAVMYGSAARYYPLWNLDLVDQRSSVLDDVYQYPDSAGAGVTAYVMDTGIRTTHTQFAGRASVGVDTVQDGWNGQDCNTEGHGTHVAGTIGGATFGLADQAGLVSVRVLGCDNQGLNSEIIAGVDWITQNGVKPAVVNMSLGGGRSTALDTAVTNSINAGFTYVVSAGNWNADACNFSPAAVPAAITVAASNSINERATGWGGTQSGSNYGTCVDIFAPGQEIRSAHNATDTAVRVLRGTSMASPHVAGAAALLLADQPALTPAEVASRLTGSATLNAIRADTLLGTPNRLLYVEHPAE